MPLSRVQKQKIIEELEEKIKKQKGIIFIDFTGVKVKEFSNLRKKLKKENSELKVAKKTLSAIPFKKLNESFAEKVRKMTGEIALIFGYQDIISPAKVVWQFSKEFPNLKIIAGILENEFLEAEKVIELAKLPSKQELLAKLIGNIFAPVSSLVRVLEGNIKGLIIVLARAKAEK